MSSSMGHDIVLATVPAKYTVLIIIIIIITSFLQFFLLLTII